MGSIGTLKILIAFSRSVTMTFILSERPFVSLLRDFLALKLLLKFVIYNSCLDATKEIEVKKEGKCLLVKPIQ